jgi:AcrR family transcriptional regulator
VQEQGRHRRRQSLPPADRERQLLDTARKLLLEDESRELTVQMVTEASGIAKGTFYLYFNSKDHLLARLWADDLDSFTASMQSILSAASSAPDLPALADGFIEQMIRYDVANAVIHRAVLFRASGDALGLLLGADAKVIELLANAIYTASGAEMSYSEAAAALLYYGVDGLLNAAYRSHANLDVETIIAAARDMVRRVLDAV